MRHTRYQGAILENDRVLLIRCHSRRSGRTYWSLPGGGLEPGETEVACVVRELKEETRLDVTVDRLLLDARTPPDRFYRRQKTFLCRIRSGEPHPGVEPEEEAADFEITDVGWFSMASTSEWDVLGDAWVRPVLGELRAVLGYGSSEGLERIDAVSPPARRDGDLLVRPAAENDDRELARLLRGSAPRPVIRDRLTSGSILVAERSRRIVGTITASEESSTGREPPPADANGTSLCIHSLRVEPRDDSAEIIEALIGTVAEYAEQMRYDTLAMCTRSPDDATRAFLSRLGFQAHGDGNGTTRWFACSLHGRVRY